MRRGFRDDDLERGPNVTRLQVPRQGRPIGCTITFDATGLIDSSGRQLYWQIVVPRRIVSTK